MTSYLIKIDDHIYLENILSMQQTATWRTMILWVLFIFVFLGVSIVTYDWRIGRPVRSLFKAMKKPEPSGVLIQIQQRTGGEIGDIAREMNVMFSRLKKVERERNAAIRKATLYNLASQVAHDIRSPLCSMQAALKYFENVEVKDSRFLDYLNILELSARRLTGIANGLLKNNKGSSPQEIILSLHKIIDELVGECQRQEQYKEIVFSKQYLSRAIELYGDRAKLQRALGNIIKNAIEAMNSQGTISIKTECNGNFATVSIQDDGSGMSQDKLDRVSAGGYTDGKKDGHGIGLTVVRETVLEYGGKVWATSDLGKGTTFFIKLPLPSSEILKTFPREETAMRQFSLQVLDDEPILIIDDDPSMLEQWRLLLSEHNVETLLFESYEALKKEGASCKATRTAIVDYHFDNSELDGEAILGKLREEGFENLYLCTAEYWKPSVQRFAKGLGVELCPKPLPKINVVIVPSACEVGREGATASSQKERSLKDCPKVLIIDDDDGIRLAWKFAHKNSGDLNIYSSMEECEEACVNYSCFDLAFVDKYIPKSEWGLGRTIEYLKGKGVKKVVVASGESQTALQNDPACKMADSIIGPNKIPTSLF